MDKRTSALSKEEFEERLKISFPKSNIKILDYTNLKGKVKLQCLNCGKIYEGTGESFFRKVNFCKCTKDFKNFHDKMDYLGEQYDFKITQHHIATELQEIECLKCNSKMQRDRISILVTPWYCTNCIKKERPLSFFTKDEIQEELNKVFNSQYELLEYQGLCRSALLKHINCGKIFTIRQLSDLFRGRNRGCPVCYQFKSAGEQAIQQFLEKENINYIPQKTFAPLNKSKYRFDFYLPDFNIAIEYQGEQHFRDNNFFKDTLKTIQNRDNIKRQYCKENGITLVEISYKELKNIPKILTSMFNDYPIREQGSSELEKDTTIK